MFSAGPATLANRSRGKADRDRVESAPAALRLVRAGLYPPLMKLPAIERARVVDLAVKFLVPEDA